MKDKIIIGIICFLVGAILATGTFFIYSKVTACDKPDQQQMQMPNNGQMPGGQNNQNGQPPDMPNNNGQSSNDNNNQNGQPPEMPNNNNNQTNTQENGA